LRPEAGGLRKKTEKEIQRIEKYRMITTKDTKKTKREIG
jgi:hypothetical protein